MDILEKKEHYSILFDFYENLFTNKQKEYFREYYFYDNSLSEIAKNYGISRAAVDDILNKMHDALDEYEEKLQLFSKFQKRQELLEQLDNELDIDSEAYKMVQTLKEIE